MREARRDSKRVIFLTGTRADYGKLKPIMLAVDADPDFEVQVFITGMHMHREFGSTYREIIRDGYHNTYSFINQRIDGDTNMDIVLAETIKGLSDFAREVQPALIVVHGDRVEALAGAIVAATNNVLLVHIEGGSSQAPSTARSAMRSRSSLTFTWWRTWRRGSAFSNSEKIRGRCTSSAHPTST